jgi:hypothetical protein
MLITKRITSPRSTARSLVILRNYANSKLLKMLLKSIILSVLIEKVTTLFLVNNTIEILFNKAISTLRLITESL